MCRNGRGRPLGVSVRLHGLPGPRVFEQINHFSQVFGPKNVDSIDDGGFGGILGGKNDVGNTGVPGANRNRQGTPYGPQSAVER